MVWCGVKGGTRRNGGMARSGTQGMIKERDGVGSMIERILMADGLVRRRHRARNRDRHRKHIG
jgi:hypothetical protein